MLDVHGHGKLQSSVTDILLIIRISCYLQYNFTAYKVCAWHGSRAVFPGENCVSNVCWFEATNQTPKRPKIRFRRLIDLVCHPLYLICNVCLPSFCASTRIQFCWLNMTAGDGVCKVLLGQTFSRRLYSFSPKWIMVSDDCGWMR